MLSVSRTQRRSYAWWLCLLCLPLAILFAGCNAPSGDTNTLDKGLHYATGFTLEVTDSTATLALLDQRLPQGTPPVRYQLGKPLAISDSLTTIPYPIRRIVCLSSTHVAFLDAIGAADRIVGVCTPDYITNPKVRQAVAEGQIIDVGSDMNLNYEAIISLKPDVVLAFSVSGAQPEFIARLAGFAIPVLMVGEYLEDHPLGRAEWIKAFGALVQQSQVADSTFKAIETNYNALAALTDSVADPTTVMLNTPWQETWYIPGKNAYMSRFLSDAGAVNLLGQQFDDAVSHSVSFEAAYQSALVAQYWLHQGSCTSVDELLGQNELFREFASVKSGKVYNNNRRTIPTGGNDFWESGVVRPDLILHDLIAIFHPELLPQPADTLYYYIKL